MYLKELEGGRGMKLKKKIDEFLFPIFNDKIKNVFFDWLLPKYTNLGGLVFIISFTSLWIIFGRNSRSIGVQMAAALCLSQGITYSLKALIKRERPYNVLKNLNTFGVKMMDYSFHSGHSSASFTVATIIFLNWPQMGIISIALASLVAISRMYIGVHYPTDVIIGIIIGISSSLIVNKFLLNYIDILIDIIF